MMHIKKATVNDVAEILKIEQSCFSTPWTETGIKESIENENTVLYLALIDNQTAGYMGVQIFSGEGYVTNIATLPEFRNRGIATALINRALQNKMEFLTLEVRKSNTPAVKLYKKLGFKLVGERPKFYSNPIEDALLFTKITSYE